VKLFVFRGVTHDPQGVLTAVHRFALVASKKCVNFPVSFIFLRQEPVTFHVPKLSKPMMAFESWAAARGAIPMVASMIAASTIHLNSGAPVVRRERIDGLPT
jgi:hypothetical protein